MPELSGVQWIDALGDGWSGPLRVRVQGGSMSPTLCPGDRVQVEPAEPDDLRPGDVVLFRSGREALLHRFLGRTPEGWMLTRGDAMASPDPPWPPEALLGRAAGVERRGRVVPIPDRPFYRALYRGLRRAAGFLRPLGRWLAALLLVLLLPVLARAAVTLVSFTATPQGQSVLVRWETASEVNMLGFVLWRAESEAGGRTSISDLIPAEGDIVGASYQFTDTDVEVGRTYFYWLEAIEATGGSEFHGPISATLSVPATATPTATPTATLPPGLPPSATPTRTRTPTPTVPPSATPAPTSTPSPTPSPSPTPAPPRTPTPSATPTARPTETPLPTPTVPPPGTPAPAPSPTPTAPPAPLIASPSLPPTLSPALPGRPSPTPSPLPVEALSTPRRTPRPVGVSSPDLPPPGWVWALLATGGLVGGGLVLWGLLILRRYRRPG